MAVRKRIDKRALLAAVIARLEADLAGVRSAALASREAAIGEESKPENEYDTRALEAGYIASAQSKRASEIAEQIAIYRRLELKDFAPDDAVDSGALVELERDGRYSTRFCFAPRRRRRDRTRRRARAAGGAGLADGRGAARPARGRRIRGRGPWRRARLRSRFRSLESHVQERRIRK